MTDSILDRLTRIATEHGRTALWLEALPWIVDTCGAVSGQILVDLAAPVRRVHGQIEVALHWAIDQWEADLLRLADWMPTGGGSLTRTPPLLPVLAPAELPVAHIPIYEGHSVIGGLSLVFATGSMPGANAILTASALTQSLARIATLAAERHQLQRRLTQGSLLYEVSRAISSSLEIDDVLNFTIALAANALGAEAAALLLVDHKVNELAFVIVHGVIAEPLRGRRMALADGIVALIVRTGQPLIVNSVKDEALLGPTDSIIHELAVRNVLYAPLQVKGETLGVLQVMNREGERGFTSEDMEWLMALAGQASVAIENARLYSILREERDRIVQTEEEVRRNLARNLHDSAAQLMGSLLINIEIARKLAKTQPHALEAEFDTLRDLAQQANQEMRQALAELRPLLLESRGLVGALQGYVKQQGRRGNTILMTVDGSLPEIQNKQAETAIYLTVQEALTNVRKHANAQHTWLRLSVQPPLLTIEVEDDGIGMAIGNGDAHHTEHGRMGVITMRERIAWLGGKVSFASPCSDEKRGTLVRMAIPLARLDTAPNADTASWIIAAQKSD